MGTLFNQLTEAKQELKTAFDNRQTYRNELETVQKERSQDSGEALQITEREEALKGFIETYNDDVVTAANKIETVEQSLDTWLQERESKHLEQYNAAIKEVEAIEALSTELQQRAQALHDTKSALLSAAYSIESVAKELSESRQDIWRRQAEVMRNRADHIARRNGQALNIRIKTW